MLVTKKPVSKKKRRNVAPASPRFMPSAQMVGEGRMRKKKKQKEEKIKTVNRNSLSRKVLSSVAKRKGRKKGRRTSESCRNPNSCP